MFLLTVSLILYRCAVTSGVGLEGLSNNLQLNLVDGLQSFVGPDWKPEQQAKFDHG